MVDARIEAHASQAAEKEIASRASADIFTPAWRGVVIDPQGPTRVQPAGAKAPGKTDYSGCVWILILVGAVSLIGKCANRTDTNPSATTQTSVQAPEALASAVAEQKPPLPQNLSPSAARLGLARVKLAAAEGLSGEMIYSQNCYDMVGRAFTWRKLDECGGFDSEAALALGDDEPLDEDKEIAWFESETSAARYLKAATAAGLDPDTADNRLAAMQALIRKHHRFVTTSSPSASSATSDRRDNVDNAMSDVAGNASDQ